MEGKIRRGERDEGKRVKMGNGEAKENGNKKYRKWSNKRKVEETGYE